MGVGVCGGEGLPGPCVPVMHREGVAVRRSVGAAATDHWGHVNCPPPVASCVQGSKCSHPCSLMVRTRLEREVGRDMRWFQCANQHLFVGTGSSLDVGVSVGTDCSLMGLQGSSQLWPFRRQSLSPPLPPPYKPGSPCSWRSGWGGGFPSSRWELSFQVTWRGHWLTLSPCLVRLRDEGVSCRKHGGGLVGQLQGKPPGPGWMALCLAEHLLLSVSWGPSVTESALSQSPLSTVVV